MAIAGLENISKKEVKSTLLGQGGEKKKGTPNLQNPEESK